MVFSRCLFAAACLASAARAADVRIVEEIVAKVNNEIITKGEIDRGRRTLEAQFRQRGLDGAQLEQALREQDKDILRDRIDQLLLVQKGKELDINVDSEVTKQLAAIQRDNKIADQDRFQEWIKQQTGMPFEDFKAEMKNTALTQRVIGQEVGSKISIPKTEVKKYYEEHKNEFVREERVFLREILVSTANKSEKEIPALEKKAKALVERARNGEKFGELARDNSDADTARSGGDLGGLKKSDLNKQIAALVFDKERGFVTDPIRISNGFLILKVEDRHQAGLAPLEEVENEVNEKLYMPRFNPAIREYLTKLRENAFLEIREGFLDSGAAPGKDTRWKDPAQLRPETVTKEEVASKIRRRRLMWLMPVPGTKTAVKSRSKSQ